MTAQASRALSLYYGANPATIKLALTQQKPSVVEELKNHFQETDLTKLSQRLSLGR